MGVYTISENLIRITEDRLFKIMECVGKSRVYPPFLMEENIKKKGLFAFFAFGEAVPLPAALRLFGAGLLGLIWIRRKVK